jgi:ribonuclease P protein component
MPAGAKKPGVSDDIFSQGRCFQGKFLRLYLQPGVDNYSVLFCVAKRIFRNKPQRNRLKRILKAAYARQRATLDWQGKRVALILCSNRASVIQLEQDLCDLARQVKQSCSEDY